VKCEIYFFLWKLRLYSLNKEHIKKSFSTSHKWLYNLCGEGVYTEI